MVIITGALFGTLFAVLTKSGNPANMGVCAICFTRDIAGALGLHRIEALSYLRPEIIGFIIGAAIAGLAFREFAARGGSSTIVRFLIGVFVAIGALVFLGCPIRMVGRLAGGDPTALMGLLGFFIGTVIGILFLRAGFSLGRAHEQSRINGWIIPSIAVLLLLFLLAKPSFIRPDQTGHAPLLISLVAGLGIGFLAQRSRFCFVGGVRDFILIRDSHLFQGFASFFLFCLIANLILGQFKPGAHPIAHTNHIASMVGMIVVGLGSVLLGGCPFRQIILSGQGNTDSGVTVLGFLVGVALSHNFILAGSPKGVPVNGMVAVTGGVAVLLILGFTNLKR